jgi:hypothetical protein
VNLAVLHRCLTLCLAALLAAILLAMAAPGAYAAVRPAIEKPDAVDAPAGGRGGVMNPFVSCTGYRVDPRVRWTLTSVGTGVAHTYTWTGAYPGMYFPRVRPGTYRSHTIAWCRGTRLVRDHTVRVGEKDAATTISRSEFDAVRRGMTRTEVSRVVGFDGRDCTRWSGRTTCTYDMMAFWAWSLITYRDGLVVDKAWDVGHD